MNKIEVQKKDMQRILTKLQGLKKLNKSVLNPNLKYFAVESQNDIKKDAPFDTGNLRQEVKGFMIDDLSAQVESIALAENNFDYAIVQEFGSRYRKGKPYFYPNIEKNLRVLLMNVIKGIKKQLKK
jgi:hypothetical protein